MADESKRRLVREAVELVGRLARSEELQAAVGSRWASSLEGQVSTTLATLEASTGSRVPLEALYELSAECIALAAAVDQDFDDGTAACKAREASCGGSSSWGFGLAVAETTAAGVACFALSLEEGDCEDETILALLERLAFDLDYFAADLFGGLCRLHQLPFQLGPEARLLRALQSICAWALIAVGRTLGYHRLSTAQVLWEWASGDALWALVLAKGALSLDPKHALCIIGAVQGHSVPMPSKGEMAQLRSAVLSAVSGLSAPDLAFPADLLADDASITSRNAAMTRHRTQLAEAVTACDALGTLLTAATAATTDSPEDAGSGQGLAGFVAALLQVTLAANDLGEATPETTAAMSAARSAAAMLAMQILGSIRQFWALLAMAARAGADAGYSWAPGFLKDCVDISYTAPLPEDLLQDFLAAFLLDSDDGRGPEPSALAALCLLAANSEQQPGGEGMTAALASAVSSLQPAALEEVADRWDRWRGPVNLRTFDAWANLAQAPAAAAAVAACTAALTAAGGNDEAAPSGRLGAGTGAGGLLQSLVQEAPDEFRCLLDGRLMMDPVRSPQGLVYERMSLARALRTSADASQGGCEGAATRCPLTGEPLALDDCARLPELRKRITQWVRGQGRGRGRGGGR